MRSNPSLEPLFRIGDAREVVISSRHPSRGATLIETVLVLPLFLFGIFFFIWWGVSLNEKAALQSGLGNAIKLGSTRGNVDVVHGEILPGVHIWNSLAPGAPPSLAPTGKIAELLVWPGGAANWASAASVLDGPTISVFSPALVPNFQSLPPQYAYTLIYVYQSLRQSIGDSVRYPCDPDAPNGAGCILCRFLNPLNMGLTTNYPDPPPVNVIAVSCRYRPSFFILGPLVRMMQVTLGTSGPLPVFVHSAQKRFTFNSGELDG